MALILKMMLSIWHQDHNKRRTITTGTTASLKASAQPRNNLQDENVIYRMEEKFCNHILNEGLRSRIYTQLIQQNSMKKWADKQNRHFTKKISKWSPGIGEDTQHQ